MPEPAASPAQLISVRLEQMVAAGALAVLLLLTLANVLTRYLTDQSFAWTEEISVFLMVLMAFSGASAVTARDQHIRIELFYDSGSSSRRRWLCVFAAAVTAVFFVLLAVLFGRVAADEIKYEETTTGLGIARWWFTAVVTALCAIIALRAAGLTLRASRRSEDSAP
jgi:TRAP-type C4-dicarboxylate transport system permease small subunit